MPSDSLSHLLETLDFAWRRASAGPASLTNIQWRADACDPGSILFFQRFADGKSDGEIYERYLAASPCAVLVTNQRLDCFDAMPGKGIYVTRPGDWAETVRRFCDLVYPLDGNAEVRCQRHLADLERLQELLAQDDSRVSGDAVLRQHASAPCHE